MDKKINKDFYEELPGCVCEMLDKCIDNYEKEKWFEKAWEEYRKHILETDMDNQRLPGFVFNKYIKGE